MQGALVVAAAGGLVGVAAHRAPRRERRRTAPPPCALFGGLFGGGKKQEAAPRADAPSSAVLPPGAATILEGTVLDGQPLQLSYDAARDGWTARAFHRCCDNKGPVLLLARSEGGARFGAFNPLGFASREDYRDSNGAFLLRWADNAAPDDPPEYLAKVGSPAIFDYGANGPCFGADALKIPLGLAPQMGSSYAGVGGSTDLGARDAAGSRAARSRLGSHYERRGDGGRTLFTDEEGIDAQLTELLIYTSPGREGYYL